MPDSGQEDSRIIELIADSGATDHMIHDKSYLVNTQEITPRHIVLGNGATVVSRLKGELVLHTRLQSFDDRWERKLVLEDVLFVPGLESNLISVGRLCENGHKITYGGNGFSSVKDGLLRMQGRKIDGLYIVKSCVNGYNHGYAAKAASLPEDLWHERLAHANVESIRKLQHSGAVRGLHLQKDNKGNACKDCIEGKLMRRMAKFNPTRSTAPGAVIHSDVCGPMSEQSLGGSKYFTTFIDEYSGFIYVVPIKQKSDVLGEFRKFLVWFERKFDCVIKRLHSDGGGEYVALKCFLVERGIEFTHSPPYSPNQNAISERANRTLVEATRAMLARASLPKKFWAEAVR